jgi:hypothetical protein
MTLLPTGVKVHLAFGYTDCATRQAEGEETRKNSKIF